MRPAIVLSLLLLVLMAPLAGAGEWVPVKVVEFQGIQTRETVFNRWPAVNTTSDSSPFRQGTTVA
ncbi:hypothetical protein [Thermococcus aciditolerans]|uniref:hypothetical protein n=1 Tax=Thermococcus aciditolerans TaxID=2598455 RepID=UPI00143D8E40|nr:hypothetical protein [Thermococcus aciditolerans]